jgi:rhodanese-related sulfurtransferase
MKAESRRQKAEVLKSEGNGQKAKVFGGALLLSAFCLLTFSCRTVGISKTSGGFAEISPPVAAEMILDSQQIVVIDIRPSADYRGPEGHIAGAISAPFETIEMHLPELLPYQNQTVLVYGETSADGAVAAQLLTVAGFRNVVHVIGGLKSWIARGYRTVNAQ